MAEHPFDFQQYIERQLRGIDDLDERQFAKQLLWEGLGKIVCHTEKKYADLERRIRQEIEVDKSQYKVVTTIIDSNAYDPTNKTLFPIYTEDFNDLELARIYSTEKEYCLGTIFLEMTEKLIVELQRKETFLGKIFLDEDEAAVYFYIRPSSRYKTLLEQLYQTFQDNQIIWTTVNTAYLDKFYDVFIKKEEIRDKDIKNPITLGKCCIDFGKHNNYIKYNIVPLWNIEEIIFKNETFMVPCVDEIYYEHEFIPENRNLSDGYLLQNNEDIIEIRQEKDKVIIKSIQENYENWIALHIVQRESERSLDYNATILTNQKKSSFIQGYVDKNQTKILTKSELFRRIMELDIQEYIEIVEYEICDYGRAYAEVEGMNWFIRDELFPMESRKILLLKFQEKIQGHYLSDSIVRFVISQIQLEISEYRCVGVIL